MCPWPLWVPTFSGPVWFGGSLFPEVCLGTVKGNQTLSVQMFVSAFGCSASELLVFEESPILRDRALYSSHNLMFPYTYFPSHFSSKRAVTVCRLHQPDFLVPNTAAGTNKAKKQWLPKIHSGATVTNAAHATHFRGSKGRDSPAPSTHHWLTGWLTCVLCLLC